MKAPDRERAKILLRVRNGATTPEEAENWARDNGFEPFANEPDPLMFDALKEAKWTLPMAAAWFIWRSVDAVRDQWNPARITWKRWVEDLTSARKQFRRRRRWRLKKFGPANLAELFLQTGFGDGEGLPFANRDSPANSRNPRSRLKLALISGKLAATYGETGNEIPRSSWDHGFDQLARTPRLPRKLDTSARKVVEFPFVAEIKRKTQELLAKPLPEGYSDDSAPDETSIDLPDLGPDASDEIPKNARAVVLSRRAIFEIGPYDGDCEIYADRECVVEVEREISQREYDSPEWDLGQALGWFAYRDRNGFRSLWAADLNPRPTYHGKSYNISDYTDDPTAALKQALLAESLEGYIDGKKVLSEEWLGAEIWDRLDVIFLGRDVRRTRAKARAPKVASPKKISMAEARKIYDEIQISRDPGTAELGVNKLWEIAKRHGATRTQIIDIHAEKNPDRKPGRKNNPFLAP
jgi:hypothetical protein